MANNKIQAEGQQYRVMKYIPLTIYWNSGVPEIEANPENESIALTDTGTGHVTLTFASASQCKLMPLGHTIEVADANTLSLEANIDGVPTTTVLAYVINSGADGATETDPVRLHLLVGKMVVA